jgi:metal-responsive CopG/Arc/MetJ family transcriptional regulator
MKTIQITIEDELLDQLDQFLDGQSRARSAFIRDSIAARLRAEKRKEMDRREEAGYRQYPQTEEELIAPVNWGWEDEDFSAWEPKIEPR